MILINRVSIKKIIDSKKINKLKIGLCHGVFDVVHPGHINHFLFCKTKCDFLVVSVTSDNFVMKGPHRPIFTLQKRMEFLESIKFVDLIIPSNYLNASYNIELIKPQFYFKGQEYNLKKISIDKNLVKEINSLKKNKGKIIFSNGFKSSSSMIVNNYCLNQSNDQSNFLNAIKKKYNLEKFNYYIDLLQKISPTVVGELIIDDYVFCEAIGKSGKEPVLVIKELNNEKIIGGAAAIANNLSSFCAKVNLLTYIGEKKEDLKFIKDNLSKNIKKFFLKKKGARTIIKKRYVEYINNTKILGVYDYNDKPLSSYEDKIFKLLIQKNAKSDVTIVSDFAHGLISDKAAKFLSNNSKYLAINCQLNASNISHHSINKYKKSNLVLINESELRHELRDKDSGLDILVEKLKQRIKTKKIVITKGKEGAFLYDIKNKNNKIHCPALTTKVVDKIGAGDAMFAMISVCLSQKIPDDISLFFGSISAAYNAESIGNKNIINLEILRKTIKHILA